MCDIDSEQLFPDFIPLPIQLAPDFRIMQNGY